MHMALIYRRPFVIIIIVAVVVVVGQCSRNDVTLSKDNFADIAHSKSLLAIRTVQFLALSLEEQIPIDHVESG